MQRQRKALLAMPLLVVPFLTLLFWAFGGGKGVAAKAAPSQSGLDLHLPAAKPKDEDKLDKMDYYQLAAKDSERLRQQIRSDPYYKSQPGTDSMWHHPAGPQAMKPALAAGAEAVSSEAKARQKLAELEAAISRRPAPIPARPLPAEVPALPPAAPRTQQQGDPELSQMNLLLEKILDIQHPDRLRQPAPSPLPDTVPFRGIPALVEGTQRIIQGTVIRLKLLDSVTINGHLFKNGQLIYGSGSLSNQRYTLRIKSIHIGNALYPVDLTVFDQTDGLEGISVPEAITGEAIGDGATSGVQGMELMSLDPSVSGQLAGAGINAAKGLFSKKVRQVKGKIKNGHPLLLRINGRPK